MGTKIFLAFCLMSLAVSTAAARVKLAEISGTPGLFTSSTGVVFDARNNAAFITNPGSGVVTKFRPLSGEVLATLQLPAGIGPIALSHDGLNLVVANITNQRVYVIEPVAMQVRKETGYEPSGFTGRCNILFGDNSIFFFIADPSRNSVAVFSTWQATFVQLISVGINPTALALRPGNKEIAVLCSGTQGNEDGSVYFFDTSSLNPVDYTFLPRLFSQSFNNLSYDSSLPQIYLSSFDSAFGESKIVVYDRKTGLLSYRSTFGKGATKIFTPPNGRFLAVTHKTSKNVALLSLPDLLLFKDIVIPGMEFSDDTTLAFSTDSHTLIIPSLATGEIILYNVDTLAIANRIAVGKTPIAIQAAPAGAVVTSLDLGSNVLSLIALNPITLYIPDLIQNASQYSGIAVANFGDEAAGVSLIARDNSGALIPGTMNPRLVRLKPNEQIKGIDYELLGLNPSAILSGYVEVYTLGPSVSALYLTGNTQQTLLDGFVADSTTSRLLSFARITEGMSRFGSLTSTEIVLLNPTESDAHMQLRMYYRTLQGPGSLISYYERTLPAHNRIRQRVIDFMPSPFYPLEKAYIEVTSDIQLKGLAFVRIGDSLAILPALARGLPDTSFVAAQFASGGGGILDTPIFSELSLGNANQEPITVTAQVVDSDGKRVPAGAKAATITILPNEVISGGADALLPFPNPLSDPRLYEGTMQLSVDKPGLLADLLYGDARNGSYLASAHLKEEIGTVFGFGHLAQGVFAGTEYYTGLAMYNPTRGLANLVIDAYAPNGTLLGRVNFGLNPGERRSRTLGQLIPNIKQQNGGTIKVTSDAPLVVYGVWGGKRESTIVQQFLAAVPPVVLQR